MLDTEDLKKIAGGAHAFAGAASEHMKEMAEELIGYRQHEPYVKNALDAAHKVVDADEQGLEEAISVLRGFIKPEHAKRGKS